MATLHGSWLSSHQRFFIWGEVWRRIEPDAFPDPFTIYDHPYGLSSVELAAWLLQVVKPTSKHKDAPPPPLLLADSLVAQLEQVVGTGKAKRGTTKKTKAVEVTVQGQVVLALPVLCEAEQRQPIHSAAAIDPDEQSLLAAYPWRVEGWWLTPDEMLTLLLSLPLGQATTGVDSLIGADLRFWGHTIRWSLDLLARGKFLPAINLTSQAITAFWQPLLESAVDQQRLRQFAATMPPACLTYQTSAKKLPSEVKGPYVNRLLAPQDTLVDFLRAAVDARVRAIAKTQPIPITTPLSQELPIREWLQALAGESNALEASPAAASRLREALNTWTAPLATLQGDNAAQYRVCFTLTPPEEQGQDWLLSYHIQAVADPEWRISAATIWQHPVDHLQINGRTLESPQETLLSGLGRAARLYEPIRDSLINQQPQGCHLEPIQAFQFIKATAWQLQDNGFGVELPPGLTEATGQDSRLGLNIRAQVPQRQQRQRLGLKSLLNFEWTLSIAGETLTKREFDQLLAQGSPLVEINGKWVELRPQEVNAAQRFFTNQKADTPLSVEDAIRISTGDTQVIDKLPVVSFEATGALQKLIDALTTGNQTLEAITEPDGFRGSLRPYQARGVSWLAFLEQWGLGACLADDMGLGKTIQLIAFLLYLRQQDFLELPVLLICPTSVLGNWEKEVQRFAPKLKVLVHHGDKRARAAAFARTAKSKQLVITSYALVYRDLKDLQRIDWQGIVLDEAQNIKNPDAKQSKAVRQLEAQFRIALTGTPVENRLGELWSIMDFLNPGYLGPRNFFQRRFATPIERYGDTASLQSLRSLVQPFILRRLKTDRDIIQDLPDKQEMTIFCGLSAEQASLYQKLVEESLEALNEVEGVQRRGQILALLTKLKQICNHPAQFLQEKAVGSAQRSAKLQRLDEMLEELIAEGDHALIFTQFAEWGKLLREHLQQHFKQEPLFLYGSTSRQQREAMVDRFQHDPNAPRIFILSLKAGGVGLNLTRANHVFHFDRWWNPAVENQATDRAFRIGQTRNVQVHKFVCTGTLEERIHDMIESKKALSEQVVGAGENWLTELDTDQLRNLLLLDRNAIIDEDG